MTSVKESSQNRCVAQYGVLRSIITMKRALGLAFTRSPACASSADQSYCLNPFQMSGYSQYGAPMPLIVFAAKKHLFVMPIAPNWPVRSSSLLKLRYVTQSCLPHCASKPAGTEPAVAQHAANAIKTTCLRIT